MKRFYILSLILALIAASSCQTNPVEGDDSGNGQGGTALPGMVVFTGNIHNATKVNVDVDGVVTWHVDDQIGVWDGERYVKAEILEVNGSQVKFGGFVNPVAETYIAVVPYEMGLVDGAFAEDGQVTLSTVTSVQAIGNQVVSIAQSDASTKEFLFKNVCNLVSFYMPYAEVVKARLTSVNQEDKCAGQMTLDPATGDVISLDLSENYIEVPVNLGHNFIAVPPGVVFPDGLKVEFYCDDDCTEYFGEILWETPFVADGGRERNVIFELGTIDKTQFDNYMLWQNGKTFTIAGEEYSRATTGFDGVLVKSPKNGSVDLAAVADKKSGAFFLDDSFTGQINFAKLVDVGTTSEAKDVLLISRYDAKRATVVCSSQKTTNLSLVSGNLRCKGLHFFLQGSQSEQSTIPLFRTYRQKFGDLHLDDCKFTIPSGGNILLWNNIECRGLNTVKFHNSEFESTRTDGRVEIIHAVAIDTDPDPENITYDIGHFEEIDSLDFYNNVFYNKTPSAGVTLFAVPVFESGVDTLATRTQNTVAKIRNNTFYNMPSPANTYLVTHSLDSLDITNNIFHNSVTDATSNILAFSQNDKERYPYEISGNIVVNITNLNKFNPWRGVYSDLKETLPVTTESIFVSPDPIGEKNFAVKNAWSSCGVRVNCR